ncbi:thioesterase II family protein [Wenjunlia tyrosinilytica]|uniref:Thioesterase n=1 Tax=Wenjunlia tyrosinilytica TaxID=1544741 RepID=A0A918DZL3_9ACTN|nr:alpha/beta fold hydrolase [Wenjunlia tyrosinilytica]GGO94273.1 thioesterase [Wenjunlia tyrosinilytica]
MTDGRRRLWVTFPRPRPDAQVRLYCLPYAGAGASAYRDWPRRLADLGPYEVAAVQYPGRENRLREDPAIDLDAMAGEVLSTIDRPYAVFGHSIGARLAFELCRRLRRDGAPPPLRLFAAGCPSPQYPPSPVRDSDLPDDEFAARVDGMGGLPAEVLADPELREMVLPVLRSDFKMVDDYVYVPEPPLPCPITAFVGDVDPEATEESARGWEEQATGSFSLHVLPGDHFFLHSSRSRLLNLLAADLSAATATADSV